MYTSQQRPQFTRGVCLVSIAFVLVLAAILIGLFVGGVIPSTKKGSFLTDSRNDTKFNIELRYTLPVKPEIADCFAKAKDRWERIITNDVDTSKCL